MYLLCAGHLFTIENNWEGCVKYNYYSYVKIQLALEQVIGIVSMMAKSTLKVVKNGSSWLNMVMMIEGPGWYKETFKPLT